MIGKSNDDPDPASRFKGQLCAVFIHRGPEFGYPAHGAHECATREVSAQIVATRELDAPPTPLSLAARPAQIAETNGFANRLGLRAHMQLVVDASNERPHRVRRHSEPARDLIVGRAVRE